MRYLLILFFYAITLYAIHMNIGYENSSMNEYSKKDIMISMEVWIEEMLIESNNTASFTFYDNSQKMADDFHNAKLDLVLGYGLDFIKYFDKSKLVDGFSGGMRDKELENMVVIIPKEISKEEFRTIKNPRIAIRNLEELPKLYVKYMILKNFHHSNITFVSSKKRKGALLKLFFGKADAAIVTLKTFNFAKELNPQIGKKLKIAHSTDITASSFGFFRKGFDIKTIQEVKKLALNIDKNERGKQVLSIFKSDTVSETTINQLAPIEELYLNYKRLKNETNR